MKRLKLYRSIRVAARAARFLLLSLALLGGCQGKKYYVDPESRGGTAADDNPGTVSKPWRTIQRAFADQTPALKAGDTLWLRGGEYPGPIQISRSGAPGQPITLRASPGETPVIVIQREEASAIDFGNKGSAGGNHLVLDSLHFRGPIPKKGDQFPQSLILASQKEGLRIKNCRIQGGEVGINLWTCRDVEIANCTIQKCRSRGIQFPDGCANATVSGNTIDHIGEIEDGNIVLAGAIGILALGPLNQAAAIGLLGQTEPEGTDRVRFQIQDIKTGEPLDLNFRPWNRSITGRNPGETVSPTVLLLFSSADPIFPYDHEIKGGGQILESGVEGFALRNQPDWNNQPYSPDQKWGCFDPGQVPLDQIRQAKYAFLYHRFLDPADYARDVIVENNDVHHCAYEGIHFRVAENVLIRNNRVHHMGCSGIQIESQCRNLWIEGNQCQVNSRVARQEANIWIHSAIDTVVQNNTCAEGVFGIFISATERAIVRRNRILNNCAQHVYTLHETSGQPNKLYASQNACGLYVIGHIPGANRSGSYVGIPVTKDVAVLHNMMAGNGTEKSNFGSAATLGRIYFGGPSQVLFFNNLVYGNQGKEQMALASRSIQCDGNLYGSEQGAFTLVWRFGKGEWTGSNADFVSTDSYDFLDSVAFDRYRAKMKMDAHSVIQVGSLIDFSQEHCPSILSKLTVDRGVSLARTTAKGTGSALPVTSTLGFSAGFRLSSGKSLIQGDEIMIGGKRAVVTAVDREHSRLLLDRKLAWDGDEPVAYAFAGSGPDIGPDEQ